MKALKVPTIFTAVDKFSRTTQKMGKSAQTFATKAEASIARGERAFRRFTPAIGAAAKQFLQFASAAAIGAAIIGGVTFSVKSLMDYEKALASTQAITGTTDAEFKLFRAEIDRVAKTSKKSAVDIAKAFEIVGSEKPELLASADALGKVTEAVTILSKASGDDLESSAKSLTGVMNQFSLGAEHSNRVMNVLAAGAKVGSANITMVSESMKNFGSVAAGANLSVEQSVGMIEVLAKFGVKGAEAGTKLRGSLLKLQAAGLGYASGQFDINDALAEANQKISMLSTAKEKDAFVTKMFGAENVSTGKILLSNIDLFNQYTAGVTGTNTAQEMAAKNSDTLTNRLDELKNQWVNLITGANGSSDALDSVKSAVKFVTDNLDTIVAVGIKVVKFFTLWKVALVASKVALKGYNILMGVSNALQKTAAISVGQNATALKAYTITTKAAAIAQRFYNVVLLGNPIVAVTAAVIGITAAIYAWTKATKAQTVAEKMNASLKEEVIENTADQLVQSKLLFKELKGLEGGTDAYNSTLQKLEQMQPGIIEKHNLQTKSIEALARAEKDLAKNIMERATADAIASRLRQTMEDIITMKMEGPEEQGIFGMNQDLADAAFNASLAEKQAQVDYLAGAQGSIESGGFDALFNQGTVPVINTEAEKQNAGNQAKAKGVKDLLTIDFKNMPDWVQAQMSSGSSGTNMPSLSNTN